MRGRVIAFAVTLVMLSSCGGHCNGQARPEAIALDASALLGHGTDFEVCIIPDDSGAPDELCAPIGSAEVGWSAEELPDSFGYVARWFNDEGQLEGVEGRFDLLCVVGTAEYFLGPDY